MQGQHRQADQYHGMSNGRNASYNSGYYKTTRSSNHSGKPQKTIRINEPQSSNSSSRNNRGRGVDENISDSDTDVEDIRSGSYMSDQMTEQSDNISTIPLKSVISSPSTVSPSVLSADNNIDVHSINASTTETSIAPSSLSHLNPVSNNRDSLPVPPPTDRDSESIVTSTSSNIRVRRRSLETTSSTAGIAPASIMERISVQPTTNTSAYTSSINDRDVESQNSKYN